MVTRVTLPPVDRAPSGPTHAYLVGDELLIDPAVRAPALDEAVAHATPGHVAVTHHHHDHVGAVADYATEYDLTVWARRGRDGAFADAAGIEPDRTFAEGTSMPGGVAVWDTPGHAAEHVAFAVSDGLLAGDLVVADGSVVVGGPSGDMRAYLSSLRRVHASNPDRLYPAHGPVIEDARATCARLIQHRLDRERRVVEAVREGGRTADEIVDMAYDKDVSAVRDLARATVVAHLAKLAVEGHLDWDGERVSI